MGEFGICMGLCLLAIPAFFIGLVLLTVAVAMWERRVVWYFVPVDTATGRPAALDPNNPYAASGVPLPQVPPPSVDASQANAAMKTMGFEFLGTCGDAKGAKYHVRYDFWVAPERDVLVNVGCGKVIGIDVDARWLYTRLQDGRTIVTVSDQSASEYDLTGQRVEALVSAISFQQLLSAHRKRIKAQFSLPLSFGPDPLKDLRTEIKQRVDTLVASGYAKHLDPQQATWSYTLLGALLFAPMANGQALRRQLIPDSGQP
ncbi:MAG TPA: hypothetical protein VFB80_16725 [Pirellulaceae bacterium]|nr:hypothetical protein [Pirellulaceae bacterium]